jgi:hypothetical protein
MTRVNKKETEASRTAAAEKRPRLHLHAWQILVAIAESGVYRQLVDGVCMVEPVCDPCVGMGAAVQRQLAAHV